MTSDHFSLYYTCYNLYRPYSIILNNISIVNSHENKKNVRLLSSAFYYYQIVLHFKNCNKNKRFRRLRQSKKLQQIFIIVLNLYYIENDFNIWRENILYFKLADYKYKWIQMYLKRFDEKLFKKWYIHTCNYIKRLNCRPNKQYKILITMKWCLHNLKLMMKRKLTMHSQTVLCLYTRVSLYVKLTTMENRALEMFNYDIRRRCEECNKTS